ncbi:MAG TPA: hypothetical protein PJ982_16455, partial [Lacipirellulaceae bacterium]|nr:hypothetical protein [Lacipirellulaceae bacterium]
RLDRPAMVRGVQDRAERPTGIPIKTPLTHAVELGEGRLAAGADGAATLVLSGPGGVRSIELSDPLAGPLAAWNGQLVAATAAGQVFSLNPDSGEPVATPFQPELAPNQRYRWLAPAAVETPAGPGLAVSDGEANIYLLKIVPEPTPHLALATSADVGADPLDSRLAVAGNTVLAATLGGRLARYAIPDLAAGDSIELGARAKWGPFAYGDGVRLATEAEELLWVGSNGTVHWRRALDRGAPRSQPLFDGDSVLAIVDGGVMRVSLKDGSETGFAEVGQPVAAGPVRLGERLVVTTPDGALLVVNRP